MEAVLLLAHRKRARTAGGVGPSHGQLPGSASATRPIHPAAFYRLRVYAGNIAACTSPQQCTWWPDQAAAPVSRPIWCSSPGLAASSGANASEQPGCRGESKHLVQLCLKAQISLPSSGIASAQERALRANLSYIKPLPAWHSRPAIFKECKSDLKNHVDAGADAYDPALGVCCICSPAGGILVGQQRQRAGQRAGHSAQEAAAHR